jgi:hypothetical protein
MRLVHQTKVSMEVDGIHDGPSFSLTTYYMYSLLLLLLFVVYRVCN